MIKRYASSVRVSGKRSSNQCHNSESNENKIGKNKVTHWTSEVRLVEVRIVKGHVTWINLLFSPSVTKMFRRWRSWTRRWSCQNRRRLWNSRWDGGLSRGVTGDTYGRWRSQYHPLPQGQSPLGCLWGYRSRQRGRYRVGDVRPLQEQFCPCRWWSGREVRTRP